ncbi:GGDEF domain-containing protein [Roseibium denhamense]|uniref:diguanylate cyclase n=1 Tax=Roseibium denhamense TaxID=76305 RepID=A0ABY1NR57_9HYPH|nr:diguanylate cyclase [Roseibium denhamense]SMP16115.1 diguanylate cyclase (GGDEF) domain-containing protein [Roseibium denhamense]
MTLDAPTLFTSVTITQIAGAAIMLCAALIWRYHSKSSVSSLFTWSAGLILLGSGAVLLGLRGQVPDAYSLVLANTLFIAGALMRASAMRMFFGLTPFWALIVLPALGWLALCLFYPPFLSDLVMRVNYVQFWVILSGLMIAHVGFFRNREKLVTGRALGVIAVFEASGYIWYVVNHNVGQYGEYQKSFSEPFMAASLLIVLTALVLMIALVIAAVVERSLNGFKEQADTDALTGLANRRAFYRDARASIAAMDDDGRATYSIIMLDLDCFKSVNDRFSHAMGDNVLQLFSRVTRNTIPDGAVAGRLGGEEFAIFMPGADREFAHLTAQRICRQFSTRCQEASSGRMIVSASAGVVTARKPQPFERVLEAADRGVYKAKRKGRAQIVVMDLTKSGALKWLADEDLFSTLKRKAA